MSKLRILFAAAALVVSPVIIQAAEQKAPVKPADIRAQIAQKLPGVKLESIKPSMIDGIYEVTVGSMTAYVSGDGKYMLTSPRGTVDMYDLDTQVNLTEARRNASRAKALAELKDDQLIVFSPQNPKHTITVFTDIDCAYCRKLHSEIAQINQLGIRVRYAAYPRSGPGTDSWRRAEAVWCSKDRKDAITRAKLGQELTSPKCAAPIAAEYELGEELGVEGTPAVMTESGEIIGGYIPAAELAKYLDSAQQPAAAQKSRK